MTQTTDQIVGGVVVAHSHHSVDMALKTTRKVMSSNTSSTRAMVHPQHNKRLDQAGSGSARALADRNHLASAIVVHQHSGLVVATKNSTFVQVPQVPLYRRLKTSVLIEIAQSITTLQQVSTLLPTASTNRRC